MKKKKKMWKKQCCTQFTIFIVLMIFFFWLWGEIWAGCRTWRWGLLLTSRNPVEFPDCEEALLTHCLFCWESDDELLRQAVGGALPARCKAALFPLAEQSQYISSLTNNVRVSRGRVFRALRGQTERPRRKLSAHPLKDCKIKVSMFWCVVHGPLFVLMSSEGTQACHDLHFECMLHGFFWLSCFSLCFQWSHNHMFL